MCRPSSFETGWIAIPLVAALLASACSDRVGCDVCTTSAIAYGVVRDTSGQPVSGVHVTGDALRDSCSAGTPVGWTDRTPTTDAQGRYRALLLSLYSPFSACLRVTAQAPSGSPWLDTTIVGPKISFRGTAPLDSIRVDLVLRSK